MFPLPAPHVNSLLKLAFFRALRPLTVLESPLPGIPFLLIFQINPAPAGMVFFFSLRSDPKPYHYSPRHLTQSQLLSVSSACSNCKISDLLPLCPLSRPSPRDCPYVDHSTVFHLSAPTRGKDPTEEGMDNSGIREGEKGWVSGVPRRKRREKKG